VKGKIKASDLYREQEDQPEKKRYVVDDFSLHPFVIKMRVTPGLWGVKWCPEWIRVKGFSCKKQAESCLEALREEADRIGSEYEYKLFAR